MDPLTQDPRPRNFEVFSQSLDDFIPILGNDGKRFYIIRASKLIFNVNRFRKVEALPVISRAQILALPQVFNPQAESACELIPLLVLLCGLFLI